MNGYPLPRLRRARCRWGLDAQRLGPEAIGVGVGEGASADFYDGDPLDVAGVLQAVEKRLLGLTKDPHAQHVEAIGTKACGGHQRPGLSGEDAGPECRSLAARDMYQNIATAAAIPTDMN